MSVVTLACGSATTTPDTGVSTTIAAGAVTGGLVPGEPVEADLDGDGAPEQIEIDPDDCSLTITDGSVFYRSRDKWHVVQAVLGDTDHNGLIEVVTLLDSDKGRHLGLFAYFGGVYRERLVTQAIRPDPIAIEVVAADSEAGAPGQGGAASQGGSGGDFVVLVQPPAPGQDAPQRTLLRWNGFGYTRVETSPAAE